MHQGCVAGANEGGEGTDRVVADIASSEEIRPRGQLFEASIARILAL
jgi:hypothetical protein